MTSLAELFSDEISELSKHVKSEEEINKYSTQDDLGEVRRSIYILKKGYQSQKISIIENLQKAMTESGSNEEFLPIILNSLELWDMSMQTECAKSFQNENVIKMMTPNNQVKLMDECLNIVLNGDISQQEEFVNEWMKVFKVLCPYLNLEYIRYTVIIRIADLPSLKQTLPWRKLGFNMFWSLAMGKGEELIKAEPLIMKTIISMCGDNNWRIRRDAAKYLNEFLKELNNTQIDYEIVEDKKEQAIISPRNDFFRSNSIQSAKKNNRQSVQELQVKPKLTKERFRDSFYDLMAEFTSDQELLVRVEGIDMFIEYIGFLTKADLENDLVPHLQETLEMLAKDDSADDETEIRMIRNLGNIADKLSKLGILRSALSQNYRLEITFIEYFKACMNHPVMEVRQGAAYNLPCFFLHFRFWEPNLETSFNEFDDSRSFLDRFYLELCQDPATPVDILSTLAAGIHEVMQLFPSDLKLPLQITESQRILFNTNHYEVKEAFSLNIDKIIKLYLRKEDQKLLIDELKIQSDEQKKGTEGSGIKLVFQKKLNTQASGNLTSQTEEVKVGTPQKNLKGAFNFNLNQSKGGDSNVPLTQTLDIELCPDEWQHEYVYSKLLESMMPLINSIIDDKTKWRIKGTFIRQLANALSFFNPSEIQDQIYPKIKERMKESNDFVKQACSNFIANLIFNQYRTAQRTILIDTVINEFGKSNSFSLRKCFIMFCTSAVSVLSFDTFKKHFFSLYLKMAEDKIQDVRIAFLNSVVQIRPYLELDSSALNEFNVVLSSFLMDQSPIIFELTNQVDMKLLRLKRQIQLAQQWQEEQRRIEHEQRLKERDVAETEARLHHVDSNKCKIELVTIFQLSNMFKKHKNGIGPSANNGGPPLQRKTTNTKKKDKNSIINTTTVVKANYPTPPPSQGQNKTYGNLFGTPQISESGFGSVVTNKTSGGSLGPAPSGNQILESVASNTLSKFKKKFKKEINGTLPPINISQQSNQNQPVRSIRKIDINLNQTQFQQITTLNTPHTNTNKENSNEREDTIDEMKYFTNSKIVVTHQINRKTLNASKATLNHSSNYVPQIDNSPIIRSDPTTGGLSQTFSTHYNMPMTPQNQQSLTFNNSSQSPTPNNNNSEMPSEVKHILWKNSLNTKYYAMPQSSLSQLMNTNNTSPIQQLIGKNAQNNVIFKKRRISSEDYDNNTQTKKSPQVTLSTLHDDEPDIEIQEQSKSSNYPRKKQISQLRSRKIILNNPQVTNNPSNTNSGLQQFSQQSSPLAQQKTPLKQQFFAIPQQPPLVIPSSTATKQQNRILPPLSQILTIRSTNHNNNSRALAQKKLIEYHHEHSSGPILSQQQNIFQHKTTSEKVFDGSKRALSSTGGNHPNINQQQPEESSTHKNMGYNYKMRLNMFAAASSSSNSNMQKNQQSTTTLSFKNTFNRQSTLNNNNSRNATQSKTTAKSYNEIPAPPQSRSGSKKVDQKVASAFVKRIVSPKDLGHPTSQLLVKGGIKHNGQQQQQFIQQ